jgi:hypothetical protein
MKIKTILFILTLLKISKFQGSDRFFPGSKNLQDFATSEQVWHNFDPIFAWESNWYCLSFFIAYLKF